MKIFNKPYSLKTKPEEIPDAELPQLYRSLRTAWVCHIKSDHRIAADSLHSILQTLRIELDRRGIERTA